MSIMQWTDDLSVGVTEIDCQHKALINIINKIHSCYADGENCENMQQLLPELKWYAMEHFKHEEDYISEIEFPKIDDHKLLHEKLLGDLDKLIERCLSGGILKPSETSEFFKNWLTTHIKIEDHQYAEHTKNHMIEETSNRNY